MILCCSGKNGSQMRLVGQFKNKTNSHVTSISCRSSPNLRRNLPSYALVKIMPHLPPTGHRRGSDHFCALTPCPLGIFGGPIPRVIPTRFFPAIIVLLHAGCMTVMFQCIFSIFCYAPAENAWHAIHVYTVHACSQAC